MVIKYIIGIIIVAVGLFQLYLKYITRWCKNKVCLVGKTVIITGGNKGIGYETALELAKRGARVILACRDEKRGSTAVESITRLTENKNVVLKLLDLGSFKSVKDFADEIKKNEKRIDILINNAGAYRLGDKLSEDGIQTEWQINHYGPVLLTLLLLDLIKKSSPSRIINVSSVGAKFATLTPNQLNTYESDITVYCNTKLANILFTQKLAKLLQEDNVSVFSLHPGPVNTELIIHGLTPKIRLMAGFMTRLFFMTPEEGAQTSIYTACEQGIEHLSGSHFEYCQLSEGYKTARDPNLCEIVWNETMKFIKYEKIK